LTFGLSRSTRTRTFSILLGAARSTVRAVTVWGHWHIIRPSSTPTVRGGLVLIVVCAASLPALELKESWEKKNSKKFWEKETSKTKASFRVTRSRKKLVCYGRNGCNRHQHHRQCRDDGRAATSHTCATKRTSWVWKSATQYNHFYYHGPVSDKWIYALMLHWRLQSTLARELVKRVSELKGLRTKHCSADDFFTSEAYHDSHYT